MFETIENAIEQLKMGNMLIVVDDENRENEGDFFVLAEHATPESVNFMAKEGRGLICTPLDHELAHKLRLHPMTTNNTDALGTAFTISVDHVATDTGISAHERSLTIQKLIEENSIAADFKQPGHVFPLIAKPGGVLERPGHTEAAVDLARLAGAKPAGVICEIMNEDGSMARLPELKKVAAKHGLPIITIQDLITYRKKMETLIEKEVEVNLPTEHGDFRLAAYTEKASGKEHLAIVKGDVNTEEPVLVRIHSECLTGDALGSNRCDCGPQLRLALAEIEEAGRGVLLYMRQEGRGIGLINKLKAYKLQEEGYDTVEANHQLGFPADLRDYAISAQMLKDLGVKRLRLLTNNPRKISGLSEFGLELVERMPIEIPAQKDNKDYLLTKYTKLGHMLNLTDN
ncbi:bifunctional 3,4-dihydroxy-2-butanone-4-phosphate synthase/GTP cyclohydrolase II [Terrihalobacillus insolitus]|uniref:bifunctional 3,4-dihydroxy-2-butanone-4-phosphate synthase/GTP cyclohydrolase II n=1 Tax=Terrihalobacillus insolitus TaxID=2950438 RepID=UPI0023403AFC|nr:bifunctional 3,4-dihydroxy-2-butanone-4-phosphate synthase/GTP cyclohydrolase II [Terrihalobacillus insolitus]MDC3413195.1 bifunctional 3,4-dihydroxy-2-butanone-4-phosphate synthase/GTP cyclohydrolase II [Terrihalobacillus insolitus]